MDSPPRQNRLVLVLLACALVIWAALFALGAYLELSADQPRRDFRKPLIIMATMAAFLSLWGMTLWVQSRRRPRQ